MIFILCVAASFVVGVVVGKHFYDPARRFLSENLQRIKDSLAGR